MTASRAPSKSGDAVPGFSAEQLRGFRIGVTSDRRSDDLITALERRGAQVLHAPALKIAPNDSDGMLVAETRRLIAARPDVVLVTTGYGMRRWLEVADAAGLGAELTLVLEQAKILARGPKAVGAIRAAGLDEVAMSQLETTASLVDTIVENGWGGLRVAIQLHGYTDEVQLERLRQLSAEVLPVTPYRWVKPAGSDRLPKLLEALTSGNLDAITFTSAPAADATLATARALGRYEEVIEAMRTRVVAAAVGPVTASPLIDAGVPVIQPDRYRMGALIRLVCEHLVEHRTDRFTLPAGQELVLRGRCVEIDSRTVMLGPSALAIFRLLAESAGAVVARQALQDQMPDHGDEHALEVAVSRLRQSIGVADAISTVVRRGYRFNAQRVITRSTAGR